MLMRTDKASLRRRGFTLIEVVAVVAMLGVLTSMLLPSVETYINRSRDMKLSSDLAVVDSAIMLYQLDTGALPASLDVLQPTYVQRQDLVDAGKAAFGYSLGTGGKGYTLTGKTSSGVTTYSRGSLVPADDV